MTKLDVNVVDLGSFKDQKELRLREERYSRYLKTLANSQLEIEANHLVDESVMNPGDKDFLTKGQLIMKEISSRATGPVKAKIDQLSKETLRLL